MGIARRERWAIFLQLPITLAILAAPIEQIGKAVLLLLVWAVTFRRLSLSDALLFVLASAVFTVMNILAIQGGVFRFENPTLATLPAYEFFMWGFYFLHMRRLLAHEERVLTWSAGLGTLVFALPFLVFTGHSTHLILLLAALALLLALFHSKGDIMYGVYAVLLGLAIEWVGVTTGEWSYPGSPLSVPPWSYVMWAGCGILLRRFAAPLADTLAARLTGAMRRQS